MIDLAKAKVAIIDKYHQSFSCCVWLFGSSLVRLRGMGEVWLVQEATENMVEQFPSSFLLRFPMYQAVFSPLVRESCVGEFKGMAAQSKPRGLLEE